ncbi:dTDP-4-dehydrorhamnose 3,5-epimerase family protein [Arenibacter certesii]|uniref:Sugar epimerase n=1 Tax=Arenibacter certesii TaxID=228955 RepID=A0A918J0D0_9FLAO|nr:dTDP-4-dehydrorhamnose 3,5-epimerase family protein [Arenibacter certesii]GGW40841.1 hypothetical protein GCM10007383_27080 [Arenibacter certesii]
MQQAVPIQGDTFNDNRGKMKFFNAFDMSPIVRFYEIAPSSIDIIRAWQGHNLEKKWFYCHSGSFVINIVSIADHSATDFSPERYELSADTPLVLEVPEGNATGFKAILPHSKLMVFSDFTLEESAKDDIRFPLETWNAKW